MRFLADESCDSCVARALRNAGHDVVSVAEVAKGALGSQSVTLEAGRGQHRKYRPLTFIEQGVAMLSSVLRSRRAVRTNVEIMRAFARLRRMLQSNAELAGKLDALEAKYDGQFKVVFGAIRELMIPPAKARRRIGFGTGSQP